MKGSTLEMFQGLVSEVPDLFKDHLSSLVTLLLGLSKRTLANDVVVRVNALKVLGALSSLPYSSIHPYKTTVLRELQTSLDDHKRVVRKEGVECRTRWFIAGDSK